MIGLGFVGMRLISGRRRKKEEIMKEQFVYGMMSFRVLGNGRKHECRRRFQRSHRLLTHLVQL
jgi:hypothetical protein